MSYSRMRCKNLRLDFRKKKEKPRECDSLPLITPHPSDDLEALEEAMAGWQDFSSVSLGYHEE